MARKVIEVTPLVSKQSTSAPPAHSTVYGAVKVVILIALWYFLSTVLSLFNKLLIGRDGIDGKGKFPAPLLLTGFQFFIQFLLARLFLDLGVVDRSQRHEENLSWSQYFKTVVSNGVSTGLDIGFSNLSLRTISLSFYTMCKSTTPLFLLSFAFLWKLEKPSCSLFGIMMVICLGIVLLVYGETTFDFAGFSLAMSAACLAGLRWTLTQVVLHGDRSTHRSQAQSGPLELVEKLTPIMSGVVLVVSLFVESWRALPSSPYFRDLEESVVTLTIIVFAGLIAFLMVWTEFNVIKETSALTFMVAGTCKEILTVAAAVTFLHESFGPINAVGLCVLIGGVSLFNFHKYRRLQETKAAQNHRDPSTEDVAIQLEELAPIGVESAARIRRV